MAGNFGALAGLANSGPSVAVFLNGWPHALEEELSCFLNPGEAEVM